MEIALEAVPLLVAACNDPGARVAQLIDEPGVLEQHHSGLGEPVGDVGRLLQRGAVRENRSGSPVLRHCRGRAPRRSIQNIGGLPVDVDEPEAEPVPDGDLEGRVAERVPQPVLHLGRRHAFGAAANDEPAEGGCRVRARPCLSHQHRGRGEEGAGRGNDLRVGFRGQPLVERGQHGGLVGVVGQAEPGAELAQGHVVPLLRWGGGFRHLW